MSAAREVMSLQIAEIAIGERVGFYHADHAARIGASIAAEGQHDPIHVRRNGNRAALSWTLVAGLHRLRGAEAIGRTEIDAIQVADASDDAAALLRLELSENLDHRQPRPIERSIFIAALARLEEAIDYPDSFGEASQVRAGKARQTASDTMSHAGGWRERVAAAMGCTVRTIERYRAIHRTIVEPFPDLAEQLNAHPIGENLTALSNIASLPDIGLRRSKIMAILDPVSSAAEPEGLFKDRKTRFGDSIITNWGRLGAAEMRTRGEQILSRCPDGVIKHLAVKGIERVDASHCGEIAKRALLKMDPLARATLLSALHDDGHLPQ